MRAYDSANNLKSQWINAPSIGATYFDYSGADGGFFRIRNTLNSDTGTVFMINSTGNVGIGTATPTSPSSVTRIVNIASAGGNAGLNLTSGAQNYELANVSGSLWFIDDNSVKMVIQNSTGNIGIGTNNPSSRFHITGSVSQRNLLIS